MNTDYEQMESSQRQLHNEKVHYEKLCTEVQIADYTLFSMLKPSLQRDGNQWRVLYGADLQEGVAGFGDSPHEAIVDWSVQWTKKIKADD